MIQKGQDKEYLAIVLLFFATSHLIEKICFENQALLNGKRKSTPVHTDLFIHF